MSQTRSVLVEPLRLEGWLTRFGRRNGDWSVIDATADQTGTAARTGASDTSDGRSDAGSSPGSGSVRIVATNGCSAVLTPPLPEPAAATAQDSDAGADAGAPDEALHSLIRRVLALHEGETVGLVLLRRGGYSVGVARAGGLLGSKTGTRYVQGRTAAGGWSQQRFARRRANQADALVEETAVRAAALFAAHPPSCLQLGGDRTLATDALAEPALARFASLPLTPFMTVADPRLTILKDTARAALSVRITVTDPPEG